MSGKAVCQTCGDIGFPEALNYCVKCGEAAEHTYCLEELPEDLRADISWTCESCILTTEGDSSDNISYVPVVKGRCFGICRQEAPYPRKKKKKKRWSISYSASLKSRRRSRSRLSCWVVDCSDMITLQKAARRKDASTGCRKRGGKQAF